MSNAHTQEDSVCGLRAEWATARGDIERQADIRQRWAALNAERDAIAARLRARLLQAMGRAA